MKLRYIGYSVSRCVNDILDDKVALDDIDVIIGSTRFTQEDTDLLIDGYVSRGVWEETDREEIKKVLNYLFNTGKLHQPRLLGSYRSQSPVTWRLSLAAPIDPTPAVKEAWDAFVAISNLADDGNV